MSSSSVSTPPVVPIRVAIRVRPVLAWEAVERQRQSCCVAVVGTDQLVLGRDRQFRFDHVFNPTVPQVEVYQTCVLPCVTSCLEGYNATVLAYGQTSSGKSYTMGSEGVEGGGWEGWEGEGVGERAGIIPRSLRDLFQHIEKRKFTESGEAVQWRVGISYVEIYQEELRDLLDCGHSSQQLVIRDNEQGHTVVVGAREERVTSCEEALDLLFAGNTSRVTAATEMNKRSSRSHAIFTVFVESRWSPKEQGQEYDLNSLQESYTCGKFHFVDLAGSERAGKTGNRGVRFKESVHINSGLLALGNVISALGDHKRISTHVPYRDSKITRLLKDSLGGNSRTVMIACLNALAENFAESLNTLKFAKRARNIRNYPIVNRDPQTARLCAMREEILSLRAELQRTHSASTQPSTASGAIMRETSSRQQRTLEEGNVTYTVTQLRRELEKCQCDLETDEVLFAEKVDELNDVQSRYEEVVGELVRLRGVWEVGEREKEGLCREVERLERLVRELETGGVSGQEVEKLEEEKLEEEEESAERREVRGSVTSEQGSCEGVTGDREISEHGPPHHQTEGVGGGYITGRERGGETARGELISSLQLISGRVRTDRKEDLSDEAVLQSMRTLTSILAQHRLQQQQQKTPTAEKETRELILETSLCEPALSQSQQFSPGREHRLADTVQSEGEEEKEGEVALLNHSALLSKEQLTETQHKLVCAHNELKDLTIKIKLKEEWVRELVKSNMMAKQLNQMYITQIQTLEQEASAVLLELGRAQSALLTQQKAQQQSHSTQRLAQDLQHKLAETEKKLASVQKKHRETQRVLRWGEGPGRRVGEMEAELERMRSRQDTMRRRLRKHTETKTKLENDVQMYQQKLQQLQSRSERQAKVLKIKTQQAAVAQRKLRQMSARSTRDVSPQVAPAAERDEEWLEEQVERILQQKETLQALEKDLSERERMVREREMAVSQRVALETQQLHCSQAVTRDITRLSVQIRSLDSSIRSSEIQAKGGEHDLEKCTRDDVLITKLKEERERLLEERSQLQEKAQYASLLPAKDEQRLAELSEHIEVLEAAIDFKNDVIHSVSRELPGSGIAHSEGVQNEVWQKLQEMSAEQAKALLMSYVGKVVDLRVAGQKKEREKKKMEAESMERQQALVSLQRSLKQAQLETDRKLLNQEKEHQQQLEVLVEQLTTSDQQVPAVHAETSSPANTGSTPARHNHRQVESLRGKVKALERELYYYKKASRDLKKKLQVLRNESTTRRSSANETQFLPTDAAAEASSHEYDAHGTATPSEGPGNTAKREEKADCGESATSSERPSERLATMSETHHSHTDAELSPPTKAKENVGVEGMQLDDSLDCRPSEPADSEQQQQQQPNVVLRNKKQLRQLSGSEVAGRRSKHKLTATEV